MLYILETFACTEKPKPSLRKKGLDFYEQLMTVLKQTLKRKHQNKTLTRTLNGDHVSNVKALTLTRKDNLK